MSHPSTPQNRANTCIPILILPIPIPDNSPVRMSALRTQVNGPGFWACDWSQFPALAWLLLLVIMIAGEEHVQGRTFAPKSMCREEDEQGRTGSENNGCMGTGEKPEQGRTGAVKNWCRKEQGQGRTCAGKNMSRED